MYFFVLYLAFGPSASAATLFPPGIRWWRLETPHFSVFYPEGMNAAAERAAAWAEWAYERLAGDFGDRPGRIRLILTDHADVANGFTTVVPERLVVVFLPPPDSAETIGDYDDWLKTVLVHELTHLFHLERAHPLYRGLRFVFGRSPLLFPNLLAPDWFTEGLATFEETRWTRGGRACSAETHMMESVARHAQAFPGPDQAWLARAPWPAGLTAYHFGAAFLNQLYRDHPDTFWSAIRAKNESLWPFFLDGREARYLGDRFSRLWTRWARLSPEPLGDSGSGRPEIVARRGYFLSGLRTVGDEVCYVNERAHEFPGIFCSDPRAGRTRRVLEGVPAGQFGVDPQGRIVASVLEWRRSFWLRSGLVRVDPRTGRRAWLKVGLRLKDPDVDPEGRIAAVRHEDGGSTALVVLEPDGSLRVLARDPTVRWSQPRWRPGRSPTFVVVAHHPDATWALELWTADGRREAEWLRDRARKMDPAWSPDGRWLLFVADYAGKLEVWAWDPGAGRTAWVALSGAGFRSPWLTPDALFVAVYAADGYHPARVPLPGDFNAILRPKPSDPAEMLRVGDRPSPESPEAPQDQCALRPPEAHTPTPPPPEIRQNRRSPAFPVVRPFTWFPVVLSDESSRRVGIALLGADRWGYSSYQAVIDYGLDDRLVRYDVLYRWDRWYPTLALRARREIAPFREGVSLATDTYETTLQVPWRRTRAVAAGSVGLRYEPLWTVDRTGRFRKLRDRWSVLWTLVYSRALSFPYSVSPEDGWTAIGWGRWGFRGRRFVTLGGDFRWYAPGWRRHHVLALRLTGAFSTGPEPEALTLGLESDDLGPVRARVEPVLVRRGLVWNVEYRWPVYEIQRSLGLFPLFMERLSVAVFYDGAHFTPFYGGAGSSQTVHAVGAEVRLHVSAAGLRATGRVGWAVEVGGQRRRRAYIALLLPF
ncbi:hypothetical protein HRbin11_00748 [bacterium HR11]|nr:hypothetical protein HRbin11_00748 [bacterium HR11]